jgi:hypothetical protein
VDGPTPRDETAQGTKGVGPATAGPQAHRSRSGPHPTPEPTLSRPRAARSADIMSSAQSVVPSYPSSERPYVEWPRLAMGRIFALPSTRLGWWSRGLVGAHALFMVVFNALVAAGQRGGETFFDNLWLTTPILAAGASACGYPLGRAFDTHDRSDTPWAVCPLLRARKGARAPLETNSLDRAHRSYALPQRNAASYLVVASSLAVTGTRPWRV